MTSPDRRTLTRLHLRDRVRALPGGDVVVHLVVFLLGAALIAVGLALIVLPGPLTIPPVLLGLAVWALEFTFAERLLARARVHAARANVAVRARPLRSAVVTGLGIALAIGAGVAVSRYDLLAALR